MEKNECDGCSSPCGAVTVSINCSFPTLEQKIIWEGVILPDIMEVLERHAKLLDVEH